MIKNRDSFMLIGKSVFIEGNGIHELDYSDKKTEFYTQLFKEQLLANLFPYSTDKKGYAVVQPVDGGIQYYAGVIADKKVEEYESIVVDAASYHVSTTSQNRSRLLFDELENDYFINGNKDNTTYSGGCVLEVLMNGNPADAVVELWVPVKED